MFKGRIAFLFASLLFLSACTQHVAKDYPEYLNNNQGSVALHDTGLSAQYVLTEKSNSYLYTVKSAMAGSANSWIVEPGKMLKATLKSPEVQSAFAALEEHKPVAGQSNLKLTFDINSYKFADFRAMATLHVTATKGEQVLLDKDYYSNGTSQGGKMFWAGALGMKNAIQQSTKSAFDKIMLELTNDLKIRVAQTN